MAGTTFSYQWQRDGTAIVGATSSTYTVTSADVGHTLYVQVTATNGSGSTKATSGGKTIPSVGTAPVNTAAPAISSAVVGQSSLVSNGTWTGTTPIAYAYQWFVNGTAVPGATAQSYAPVSGDAGKSLYCVVTASNTAGHASAQSNALGVTSGGGASVDIADRAALSAAIAAWPSTGNKTWNLAGGSYGVFGFYNLDFSTAPVSIVGPADLSATFDTMGFSNSSGLTFTNVKVISHGQDSDSSIEINNSTPTFPSVLTFNNVVTTSSAAQGTQTGGGWFFRNVYAGAITINGQGDATKPDVFGRSYGIAFTDTGWNGGTVTIRNMTFDNLGINQILGGGAQNVTIDKCLFQNQYWSAGDHPNVIHFFGDGSTPSKNITVTNCGMMQGQFGGGAITFLQEGVVGATVQNNWSLMGVFFDAWENSAGSGCTYDNNFGQGIGAVGGSLLVRGAAANCTTTNNKVTNASPFTYTPEGPYVGYTTSGNTTVSNASAWNDYAAQEAWAATHPSARAHP